MVRRRQVYCLVLDKWINVPLLLMKVGESNSKLAHVAVWRRLICMTIPYWQQQQTFRNV